MITYRLEGDPPELRLELELERLEPPELREEEPLLRLELPELR
jgi:hypothetical protein